MTEALFKRYQYALFSVITLFTLIVYTMTVAPTFSYWDCGEFIACSHILGIPHPPGTPLFVVLGRVFDLIPFSSDFAVRINFLSVITEAFAASFAFLIMVRVIRQGLGTPPGIPMSLWQSVVALGGGVSGALFMAFSTTHWNNAVEAEVYGASMLLIMLLVWLAFVWADRRGQPGADRFLVGISYLALLSLGIHMTTYLAVPVVFLFIIAVDKRMRGDWRFWVTGAVLFLVAIDLMIFLVAAGIWAALSVGLAITTRKTAAGWGLIAALMVAGWIGYTNQLYLPIRSNQNSGVNPNPDPWIDENNPETFESFRGFLERKQYGQTSMVKRMFTRRGTWANQFGDHPHMGFYRYWKNQYGFGGWAMLGIMFLGFYGTWWLWKRSPSWASMLALLFLVGSVGLLLYMNFADGTQYQKLQPDAYMEVRHRDYFYTPGYIVFGMMIGLGLAALAAKLGEKSSQLAIALGVVAALLPLRALQANWVDCDRSRNFTPYDYAWNLLQSCKPNAILFTSGDNDTFPLWCIQEVYKVRKDISIVNLSLANTDWYIYQMKHMWGLPITWTDDQILWTVMDPTLGVKRPKDAYKDPVSGNRHYLFATRDSDRFVPANMMVVEHVIMNNKWERPIYFSSNPTDKSRLGLDKHSKIAGQAFEILREDYRMDFDWPVMDSLMDNVYQYRSYDDPTIGLDDNAVGLAVAFPERMFALGEYARRQADTARWEYWLRKAQTLFPFYSRAHEQMATFTRLRGDSTAADKIIQDGLTTVSRYAETVPDNRMYWYFTSQMAELAGDDDRAEAAMARAFWLNPNDGMTFNEYAGILTRRGKSAEAAKAALKYLTYYPNDQRARQLVNIR